METRPPQDLADLRNDRVCQLRRLAHHGTPDGQRRQTDADPDTGCMEFDIAKGRFSFRLTAPYSEERRNAASKAAKKHSGNLTHPIQKDVL